MAILKFLTAFRMANIKQRRNARASTRDDARQAQKTQKHGCTRVDMLPNSVLQVGLEDAPSTAAMSNVLVRGGRGLTEFRLAVLHGPGLMVGDAVTRLHDSKWITK